MDLSKVGDADLEQGECKQDQISIEECYWLNCVPLKDVEFLTSCTCEYGLI